MASGFQFGPARSDDGTVGQFVKYKGVDYYAGDCRKPSRTLLTDDREKVFRLLGQGFSLCDPTPDAIEVVKSFPWGAYFVVFSDGSVYATKSVEDGKCGWFAGTRAESVPGSKVEGWGLKVDTTQKEFKIQDFTAKWLFTYPVNGRELPIL